MRSICFVVDVVIMGAGPVGLLVAAVAKALAAKRLIVIDM